MIERCDDKKCKGFGKLYVDRGYGFPVCPSTPINLYPLKMNIKFKNDFVGDTIIGFKQCFEDIRL